MAKRLNSGMPLLTQVLLASSGCRLITDKAGMLELGLGRW